ncbi:hypothetical protein J2S71_001301 [Olsenella profusa DSM 13989]|uniref:DUF6630 family protein n=1 Tax=Olsenella profusa TaxID=138595 RepID=UPI00278B8F62|nr:DUF6630 family protein [Olsenella profusa]MDP9859605.1 hypothetical protein [Olsenella profusa DSM 13989]
MTAKARARARSESTLRRIKRVWILSWIALALLIILNTMLDSPASPSSSDYRTVTVTVVSAQETQVSFCWINDYTSTVIVRYNGSNYELRNTGHASHYFPGEQIPAYLYMNELYAGMNGVIKPTPLGTVYQACKIATFFMLIASLSMPILFLMHTYPHGVRVTRERKGEEVTRLPAKPTMSAAPVTDGTHVHRYAWKYFECDKAEWHYDSCAQAYCRAHHKTIDTMTSKDEARVWVSAGLLIGYFVYWLICHDALTPDGMADDPQDEENQALVRGDELSPIDYIRDTTDFTLARSDIRQSTLDFVDRYYESSYYQDVLDVIGVDRDIFRMEFDWETCHEVSTAIDHAHMAWLEDKKSYLRIARIISGGDTNAMSEFSGSFEEPDAYGTVHVDHLYDWGLEDENDVNRFAHDHWMVLVDILERNGCVCLCDWKQPADEFLPLVGLTRRAAAEGIDFASVVGTSGQGDVGLADWWEGNACLDLPELSEKSLLIANMDIDSDAYVLFVCSEGEYRRIRSLAKSLGRIINQAKQGKS